MSLSCLLIHSDLEQLLHSLKDGKILDVLGMKLNLSKDSFFIDAKLWYLLTSCIARKTHRTWKAFFTYKKLEYMSDD